MHATRTIMDLLEHSRFNDSDLTSCASLYMHGLFEMIQRCSTSETFYSTDRISMMEGDEGSIGSVYTQI